MPPQCLLLSIIIPTSLGGPFFPGAPTPAPGVDVESSPPNQIVALLLAGSNVTTLPAGEPPFPQKSPFTSHCPDLGHPSQAREGKHLGRMDLGTRPGRLVHIEQVWREASAPPSFSVKKPAYPFPVPPGVSGLYTSITCHTSPALDMTSMRDLVWL